jgi:TRAP-type C4-dicarboxylate transport system substrate-binding protein
VPAFSATLMPGLIRSQDRAKRINGSQFMTDVRAEIDRNGAIVLSDAWFAGGMAAKGHCILKPDDLKGMKFRAAGPTFAAMWETAGASIVSPPSNEIYNAFQTGVITGTDTSLGTFDSTRLYEVTDCLTAPGNNALWFMYEPLLMSKMSFGRLNKQQQDAIIKAGKDAQAYFEGKADEVNNEAIKDFIDHKVKVVTLSDADYNTWLDLAKKSSYVKFSTTRRWRSNRIAFTHGWTAGVSSVRPLIPDPPRSQTIFKTEAAQKSQWTLTSGQLPLCRALPASSPRSSSPLQCW